jgi:hypothetical protein
VALSWYAGRHLLRWLFGTSGELRFVWSVAVAGMVLLGSGALAMFPLTGGLVTLGLHPVAKLAPLYLLVDLGPLFVFAVAGVVVLVAEGRLARRSAIIGLLVPALVLSFLLAVPLDPNTPLRKGLKIAQLALVVLAADAWSVLPRWRHRRTLMAAGALALLAGVTTLATDLVQYVDVTGRPDRTTYLTPAEVQALDWIRTRTPRDAVFQVLDEARPGRGYRHTFGSVVTTFGERRTLSGDYKGAELFQVPAARIAPRRQKLERLFVTERTATVKELLEELPVDYLYVDTGAPGPVAAIQELQKDGYLTEVYRAGMISVVRVDRRDR